MFSRKTVIVLLMVVLIAVHIIVLAISIRRPEFSSGIQKTPVSCLAPFQRITIWSIRSIRDVWKQYFYLVSVAKTNEQLNKSLSHAVDRLNQCSEVERSNERLRGFLAFQKSGTGRFLAAEVIGKDPSPWFNNVIIDKGGADGITKGMPVVIPEGIVGIVTEITPRYSKVLLIIDANSSVDALVKRTRARGVIKGKAGRRRQCFLDYALRKHDIEEGDLVVSSGLGGTFPKGLRVGVISKVSRLDSGTFQNVKVIPHVDFERLEEVLILLNPPSRTFVGE